MSEQNLKIVSNMPDRQHLPGQDDDSAPQILSLPPHVIAELEKLYGPKGNRTLADMLPMTPPRIRHVLQKFC